MDVNERTLKSLEWERLKHYLAAETSSVCSRELALNLELFDEPIIIEGLLKESEEALRLFFEGFDLSQEGLPDLRDQLGRLLAGASLSANELLDLKRVLELSRKLKTTLANLEQEKFPCLRSQLARLFVFDDLVNAIDAVIEETGEIRDDASPLLRKLRREVNRINGQIKDELQRLINSPSTSKALQEPIYTVRNGRHVLPVLSNQRHALEGIVHDSSSTGLTIYVEPKSVVELTNTIRINEADIEREIERLLWELSAKAGARSEQIKQSFEALVETDFIAARARLARKYRGTRPELAKSFQLKLIQAKHPLLILQSGKTDWVVPNDISLSENTRTLIITGPNTGGKTVYMKTAGLLALMVRAGLLLPVLDGSEISIFSGVFADIGDEQSLEQNLSTFSSHMSNIVEITRRAKPSTLVLLDEIGAGTDPREGVILAQVILSHLTKIGALTICSTHYGDLKTLAHSHSAYENASMEFDEKTMTPSYRMRPGIAGSSKAIAVAARLGLAAEMVQDAEHLLESSKEDFEHRVDELEQRLSIIAQREDELAKKEIANSNHEKYLQERAKALDEEHSRLRFQSANQFLEDYQHAKKLINELTANLQKTPSLSRAQKAKEKLDSIKKELDWLSPEEFKAQQLEVRAGQTVRVRSLGQIGTIEVMPAAEGEKAQVRVGRVKVKVALADLDVIAAPQQQKVPNKQQKPAVKAQQSRSQTQQEDPVFVRSNRNTLDLRGERVDEGIAKLERFLDEGYLEHLSPLMIIHGHGTGAMKSAVREFLRNCSYKNKSRPGETYEGGDGVTVVNFT